MTWTEETFNKGGDSRTGKIKMCKCNDRSLRRLRSLLADQMN